MIVNADDSVTSWNRTSMQQLIAQPHLWVLQSGWTN